MESAGAEVLCVDVDADLSVLAPLAVFDLARQDQAVVLLLVVVKVVAEPGDLLEGEKSLQISLSKTQEAPGK